MEFRNIELRKELLLQTDIPLEVRNDEEGKPKKITGYASIFNQNTDMYYFEERIAPGAFTRTLREKPDVLALWDHDTSQPIGRVAAGTLVLSEDDKGLQSEITPPDTQVGRDALELVRTGHVKGMSFGFMVRAAKWEKENGVDIRVISDVELWEVSVVTFPAYEGTSAQARKLAAGLSKRYLDPEEIMKEFKDREKEKRKLTHEHRNKRIALMEKLV